MDTGTAWTDVTLGELTATTQQLTGVLPCPAGCRLVRLRLSSLSGTPFAAGLRITAMATDVQPASTFTAALGDPTGWLPAADFGPDPGDAATATPDAGPGGLRLSVSDPEGERGAGPYVTVGDRPIALPALLGAATSDTAQNLVSVPDDLSGVGLDGIELAVAPVGSSAALPRVGALGTLVDLRLAELTSDPARRTTTEDEVWLAAGAPPSVTRALEAQGLIVTGVETRVGRRSHLASLGPARAVQLAAVTAGAGLVLAILVAAAGLLMASRARLYELASLRAIGVRPRTLRRALLAEVLGLLGPAVVVGAAVGVATSGITLPRLPFYAIGGGPPLDLAPALATVGVLTGAGLAAVVLVAVGCATGLVRAAVPARLRESLR